MNRLWRWPCAAIVIFLSVTGLGVYVLGAAMMAAGSWIERRARLGR